MNEELLRILNLIVQQIVPDTELMTLQAAARPICGAHHGTETINSVPTNQT